MKIFRTNLVNCLNGFWWLFFGCWLILHGESMQLSDPVSLFTGVVGVSVAYWQYIIVIIMVAGLSFVPQFVWNWLQAVILKQAHTAINDDKEVKRAWLTGGVTGVLFIPLLYFVKIGDWMWQTSLVTLIAAVILWGVPAAYKKIKARLAKKK